MLMVILTKMKSVRSYIDMRFFRLRIYSVLLIPLMDGKLISRTRLD